MILCNGCSFTEGYDLQNKSSSWPSRLGEILELPVTNLALGAGSNDRIVRTLMEFLVQNDSPNAVVIGWTSHDRNEISHREGFYVRGTTQHSLAECEYSPPDLEQVHRNWILYNHNLWINYRTWIYHVLFWQNYFEKMSIPYVFFSAFGDNFIYEFINETDRSLILADQSYQWRDRAKYLPERTIHKEWQELVALCKKINLDRWVLQNKTTMQKYLVQNNFKLDKGGHPKEDGHRFWANIIAENLYDFICQRR